MNHHSVAAGNIGKSKWSPRLSDETESSCCMTLRGRHRCRHREGWRGGGGGGGEGLHFSNSDG